MNNNFDKNKLINEIVSSSGGKIDPSKLSGVQNKKDVMNLVNSLPNEDKAKLMAALNDKTALNEMLKSPEAKAILNSFLNRGGKNG